MYLPSHSGSGFVFFHTHFHNRAKRKGPLTSGKRVVSAEAWFILRWQTYWQQLLEQCVTRAAEGRTDFYCFFSSNSKVFSLWGIRQHDILVIQKGNLNCVFYQAPPWILAVILVLLEPFPEIRRIILLTEQVSSFFLRNKYGDSRNTETYECLLPYFPPFLSLSSIVTFRPIF